MNTKLLTSVGCLILAATAITPSAFGHSERPVLALDLGSGYAGPSATKGVSGLYVGAAGPAVALDAYTNPQDTLAIGAMLCDVEVFIDSDSSLEGNVNEDHVDGKLTANGQRPDSFDDGGQGGACHTHYDHYDTKKFNTPGCQAGQQAHGGTHLGTDIWIGASCDWREDQGGVSSEITLVLCLVNAALVFNPLDSNLVNEVQRFVDCVLAFVNCMLDPTCGPTGATQICGADYHHVDAINYGYAGVGATLAPARFPVATGVVNPPPGYTGPCAVNDEAAAIFVFDTIATNAGTPEVYLALTGEVWS